MPPALLALTLGAFAIGTTEFVIVGLIPTIAADLHVAVPSAGLLVSLYAMGVAIGAPLLTALTGRVPRKLLLLALMALFVVGNLLAWHAPGYASLVAARILTGLAHGVFFSIGSTIAAGLVPKDKAAGAIATMFSGLTVAIVTGVPLGTFIGQHAGWRATFLLVALLGALAFLGSLAFVPARIGARSAASLREPLRVLAQPRLLLVYAMTVAGYGGSFVAFTFLAPMLQELAGFGAGAVGPVLLAYGLSVVVGNTAGGRLADRHGPVPTLKLVFAGLAAVLLVLTFTIHHRWLAFTTVLAWGAVAFGNVPALQLYVVRQAERAVPHAVDVASGLNIAAFNVGIAGGAWGGGLVAERFGLVHLPWIGALAVLTAFALTAWSGRLDRDERGERRGGRAALAPAGGTC